jgi:hypothetical protein
MDHPDFRVCGKIFATLGYPESSWGMVRLTPRQQAEYAAAEPEAFVPVNGAWGRRGATNVRLRSVSARLLRRAIDDAWANTAPRRLTGLKGGRP